MYLAAQSCQDIVTSLVAFSPKMSPLLVPIDIVSRLTGRHFPVMKPAVSPNDPRPAKRCRVCYAKGRKQQSGYPLRTRWICPDCPSQPGLHVDNECFRIYHTKLNYACQNEL